MTDVDQPASPPPARRARRADAERNRHAIIEAASAVFAEQGATVDVREIARRSSVGMGTLYRHFPTKDDLLVTVLEQEFTSWLTNALQTAAATEDPWQALTGFFEETLTHQACNRALVESYATQDGPSPECAQLRESVLGELLDRCLDAGLLRSDVTTADLALLIMSLSHVVQATGESHPAQWRRLLRISLDGLSSRNTEALPES
ncbi:TetR/AcrR family transcriptional regulator [Streptomyces capitiformicae]|uniref:TetR family transcriptional regulator n=1 Tax=Streptomyces capitiformicae TaxID=2014920 RepID=A0A918Z9X4_9ACTN|nr:TetR/AcrR family transcriptional regulator [Streptomyces capitiformicae]GHE41709.1 TetR family transcriptional regulator [Streptomyces capitiformicae]